MTPLQSLLFRTICDANMDKDTAISEVSGLLFGLIGSSNDPDGYLTQTIDRLESARPNFHMTMKEVH